MPVVRCGAVWCGVVWSAQWRCAPCREGGGADHGMSGGTGFNLVRHHSLLWIAAEALACPLPAEWSEHFDGDKNIFFFRGLSEEEEAEAELEAVLLALDGEEEDEAEFTPGQSTYEHPMDYLYLGWAAKCIAALEEEDEEELEFLAEEVKKIAENLRKPPEEEATKTGEGHATLATGG